VVRGLRNQWEAREAQAAKDASLGPLFVSDAGELRRQASDASPSGLAALMSAAAGKFRGIKAVAEKLARLAVQQNLVEVDDRIASMIKESVGVDLRSALTASGPIADEMKRSRQDNVDLITSIPEQYLDKVRDSVVEHWNAGRSYESLADRIEEIGDITDRRAALIARDQTGKMNSSFNLVRQTSLGIEKYEWQTAGDERVRDSHAKMDGKVIAWSDPPLVDGERVHPGQGIQCRCVAAPIVDVGELESEAEEAAA
jgi:SPP1 gp7 family putative phage head morphogenesis protein